MDITYKPGVLSDHSMIEVIILTDLPKRGRGFWKMNSLHFDHQPLNTALNEIIPKALVKYQELNSGLKWEMIKMQVVQASQVYSRKLANRQKDQVNRMRETMQFLADQYQITNNIIYQDEYEKVPIELELTLKKLMQKQAFLSRSKYYLEGERNTRFFFNLAKSRYENRVMYEIMDGDQRVRDPDLILKAQHRFYQKLYTKNENTTFNLINTKGSQISLEDRETLEKPLTLEEIRCAIKHFKDGKTPGVDGFTTVFYRNHFDQLGETLLEVYNYAYLHGQLHMSARCGVLSLIPKNPEIRY